MHPFDIKTVLFAKHAQHVVLIHFPIGLFIAGVAFDLIGHWRKRDQFLKAAAYYNLFTAALTTVPVVISGIMAWQWALEAQRLKGILLMHLVLGCVSSLLIWTVWLIHQRTRRAPEAALPNFRFAIEAVAVAIVAVTGHLGGFLSGVNGPG
jgi:uncharacterized membrane protein